VCAGIVVASSGTMMIVAVLLLLIVPLITCDLVEDNANYTIWRDGQANGKTGQRETGQLIDRN
jgi:hypothetical protein